MGRLPDTLHSGRLKLHRLRYEDAEEIFYAYAGKEEATRFVSWATHRSIAETREYLQWAIPAWDTGLEATYAVRLKHSGRLIGSCGAVFGPEKIQVGYILSPSQWGRGLATEACARLVKALYDYDTDLRIWTFVDAENTASIRVLEKCGFREQARHPRWYKFINQANRWKDCIVYHHPPPVQTLV
jgi:ribosomal-protein-alanine N-acetyltransferase